MKRVPKEYKQALTRLAKINRKQRELLSESYAASLSPYETRLLVLFSKLGTTDVLMKQSFTEAFMITLGEADLLPEKFFRSFERSMMAKTTFRERSVFGDIAEVASFEKDTIVWFFGKVARKLGISNEFTALLPRIPFIKQTDWE